VRILVAGPFPPSPDPTASSALRRTKGLLSSGHAVETLSPTPSAASVHGPLAGVMGAVALARRAREFDVLHLQVGRGVLFRPERPKARRILDSLALALALRAWRHTVADVGDMSDVPGGGGGLSGRLIWGAIDEIVVSSEPVRNHVTRAMGLPSAKVRVEAQPEGGAAGHPHPPREIPPSDLPPWSQDGPADWAALEEQIRQRAASERARLLGEPEAPGLPLPEA